MRHIPAEALASIPTSNRIAFLVAASIFIAIAVWAHRSDGRAGR